eukprot:TRINITY_DN80730_c0_g1_i1.p1 TRINITY_DN80730_c0_g1~~TRINITY_DN80730_c0_g1_i1.p1  ORF type:complete len:286 (-),score=36.31 TRINITY_DN80730_c0_g1_i1:13-870(-)
MTSEGFEAPGSVVPLWNVHQNSRRSTTTSHMHGVTQPTGSLDDIAQGVGVPGSVLEALPRLPQTRSGECSICFQSFSSCSEELHAKQVADPAVRLPCDHLFHWLCISKWLQQHTDCPLCRREVSQTAGSASASTCLHLRRLGNLSQSLDRTSAEPHTYARREPATGSTFGQGRRLFATVNQDALSRVQESHDARPLQEVHAVRLYHKVQIVRPTQELQDAWNNTASSDYFLARPLSSPLRASATPSRAPMPAESRMHIAPLGQLSNHTYDRSAQRTAEQIGRAHV